ncbi:hypothetical protein WJX75_009985 [Coccomyxa subellipsoidea]|uniref:BZIP domain-containing protein n=1 Tax=Coccomyxa subellipsoidea TaxID=248742 RepID=A0ABR2YKA6_9CHLO
MRTYVSVNQEMPCKKPMLAGNGAHTALRQEDDGMEDGPAHSGGSHEEHPAASPAEDHCSQHLKLQEKAKRKAERQAQAEEAWNQQEAARINKLEEQQKAMEEVEARKKRRAEELQSLRAKLELLKVEKHEMVAQLKQVLLTEDSEKARAAALAALEEGEMLAEPFPLPPPQGTPHLVPLQSMGSSTHPLMSFPQPSSLVPASFPPLQPQGSSAAGLLLHMSPPLASVGSGRLHIASHTPALGRLPPHLAGSHPTRPTPATPSGALSLPPHLQH